MTFDWKLQATQPRLVVSCFIDFCLHQGAQYKTNKRNTNKIYLCSSTRARSVHNKQWNTNKIYSCVCVLPPGRSVHHKQYVQTRTRSLAWDPSEKRFSQLTKMSLLTRQTDKQKDRQTDRQTDMDQHSIFVTKRRAITVRSKRTQTDTETQTDKTLKCHHCPAVAWRIVVNITSTVLPPLFSYIWLAPRVCCSFLSPTMHPVPYSPVHECTFLPMPPCWWMELDEEFEASLHVLGSGRGVEVHMQRLLPSSFEWTLDIPPRHHHCHCHFSDVLHIVRI